MIEQVTMPKVLRCPVCKSMAEKQQYKLSTTYICPMCKHRFVNRKPTRGAREQHK